MFGDEQGQVLALLGSASVHLRAGNEAFDEVVSEHGEHPLATYARLAKGVNAARTFRRTTAGKEVLIRDPEPSVSITAPFRVQEATVRGDGVDNITLNFVMRIHARGQALADDIIQAETILDDMPQVFHPAASSPRWSRQFADRRNRRRRNSALTVSLTLHAPAGSQSVGRPVAV